MSNHAVRVSRPPSHTAATARAARESAPSQHRLFLCERIPLASSARCGPVSVLSCEGILWLARWVECGSRMKHDSTTSRPPASSQLPAPLIDIGINLTHDSYDADRDAVIARAQAAGVVQMVITGSTLASTQRALALARAHPLRLFATAGVHPHHASELTAQRAAELEDLARQPEVVAVGECGLDYFRDLSPRDAQRRAFHRQLELAAKLGKPVFLHQREAHADFAAILREHGAQWRGVAHCFTGSAQELTCYLQLGLAIGITGWICDERRGRHLAALMPQ